MSAGLLQARFRSSLTQMVSAPLGEFRLTRNLATGCCVGRLKQYCGGSIGLSFCSTLSVKGEAMPEPLPKIRKVEKEHQNGSSTVSDSISEAFQFLRVKKLSCNAVIPSRASLLAAGYDLSSAAACVVPARGKAMVPTDLSIAIPEGTYARVAPRSGLTWKHSIDVGAGVIDADYRGPVAVILFNHSDQDFQVNAGDRIAQLIIEKISTPEVLEVDDLDSTARGKGGFGSTGV